MRVHNKPSPDAVEKFSCHICERVFKSKTMLEKHVAKHVETTAEEYKTKKSSAEKKRALKRVKQHQQQQEENAAQEESGDLESEPSCESGKPCGIKRKQRKPNRVVYDNEDDDIDDLNTEYTTTRDKLDSGHSCTYCNETFSSIALLNSHIKLHIRDKIVLVPATKAQQQQQAELKMEDNQKQSNSTDDQNKITIDTVTDENTPSTSALPATTEEGNDEIETDTTKSNKLVAAILNQINSQLDSESAKGLVLDVATEAGSLQITSISVQEDVGDNLEIEFPKDDE